MSPDVDIRTILTRRSTRNFSAKAVADDDLSTIIDAGLRAPSSKNSQPWYVAVARGEVKEQICLWVEENREHIATKPGRLLIEEPDARTRDSTFQTLRCVRAAPVLLLLFNRAPFTGGKKRVEDEIRSGKQVNYENEYVGIGACMQNMLLAAHALGLGAVAVMDLLPAGPAITSGFKIDYDLVIGIVVGHPRRNLPARTVDRERFVRYLD